MKRRAFISLLGGAAAWPSVVRAQQAVSREFIERLRLTESISARQLAVVAQELGEIFR